MIIYKLSVCCFTHMHTDIIYKQHIREMEEILRRAHNKRQYFIEPFLKSVFCKRDHV